MSQPKTDDEYAQMMLSKVASRPSENVVSTGCPQCDRRFALLAKFVSDNGGTWVLRCTCCPWRGTGVLK